MQHVKHSFFLMKSDQIRIRSVSLVHTISATRSGWIYWRGKKEPWENTLWNGRPGNLSRSSMRNQPSLLRNVPSDMEQGETAVFAGYISFFSVFSNCSCRDHASVSNTDLKTWQRLKRKQCKGKRVINRVNSFFVIIFVLFFIVVLTSRLTPLSERLELGYKVNCLFSIPHKYLYVYLVWCFS